MPSLSTAPTLERSRRPLARRWESVLSAASSWCPPAVPTTVVVPHPDDEVLATGGLIAHQVRAGVPVRIVAVTDGEAAYPDRSLQVDLAAMRRGEQESALDRLGLAASCVTRLGLPDGAVADHERGLIECLADLVAGAGLVVAPATIDHHCDHVASGRATVVAVRRHAGAGIVRVESLFWAWHHAELDDLRRRSLLRLELSPEVGRDRAAALAEHRSQVGHDLTEPLLDDGDLEPVTWSSEYYVSSER